MNQLTEHFWQVQWFGQTVNLSTLIMVWAAMLVVLLFAWASTRQLEIIPGRMQFVGEWFFKLTRGITYSSAGKAGDEYLFIVGSLFMFILFANLMGQLPLKLIGLPVEHKFLIAATGDINTTVGLALVTLVAYLILAVKHLGVGGFVKHHLEPMPPMVVLHLLDHVTRPAALAIRLFVNILVGEKLAEATIQLSQAIYGVGLPVGVIFLELGVAFLQAYIFALLSTIYINLMTSHGDHAEAHAH